MSSFSPGPFIRRAALAAATAFAAPSFAQETVTLVPVAAAPIKSATEQQAFFFRDILTLIGYGMKKESTPENDAALKSSVMTLQEGLNAYAADHPHLFLTKLETDGDFGAITARNTLRVIKEEKIFDVLIVSRESTLSREDQDALKASSDLLATLQPALFAEGLRDVVRAVSEENQNNFKGGIVAMQLAFRYCTARDQRAFANEIIENEINEVAARAGYISRVVPQPCTRMLHGLPLKEREAVQMEYLNARPRTHDADEKAWCMVREGRECRLMNL